MFYLISLNFFFSGLFDASKILAAMDEKIAAAKQKAHSRRDILEKIDKWISACEEESWLEDYNRVSSYSSSSVVVIIIHFSIMRLELIDWLLFALVPT